MYKVDTEIKRTPVLPLLGADSDGQMEMSDVERVQQINGNYFTRECTTQPPGVKEYVIAFFFLSAPLLIAALKGEEAVTRV